MSRSIALYRAAGELSREHLVHAPRPSGPAIIQISNYWQKSDPVLIDLLPETDVAEMLTANRRGRRTLANFLGELVPQRFADAFAANANKPLVNSPTVTSMTSGLCSTPGKRSSPKPKVTTGPR
ncbi:MAG: NAD(P)/FAD-dependent oxidoreductase [Acidobacteria bacterium]|nr:NAD(P)/FAD-dependent oxidoreductase [Acidobacteriota bacterium]